jgi:hypothetical protein
LALFSLGSFWLTIADFVERYEAVTYRYVLGNLRLLRNHAFIRRPLLRIRVSIACLSATSFMERYVVKPEALPEGKETRANLGYLERGDAPRPVGDGESDPQRRLQDQEDLVEAG